MHKAIQIIRTNGFKYIMGVCPENTDKEYIVIKEKWVDYGVYQIDEFYFFNCMITAHIKMLELIKNQKGV